MASNSLASYFIKDRKDLVGRKDCTIMGKKYRFTVLTDSLIRLEYSPNGVFEDRPTQRVIFRNFDRPLYVGTETDLLVQIQTKYFILDYVKNRNFDSGRLTPGSNLKVQLKETNHEWYYGHPEARNLGGTNFSLDKLIKELRLNPGLYSSDGFAIIDDSNSYVLNENDEYVPRENPEIDLYLFMYKRDFGKCLQDYYKLTGYPSLIPRYALGNWWYKDTQYTTKDIIDLVNHFTKLNIPLNNILLGSKWHNNVDKFDFDTSVIEPNELVNFLRSRNIKLGLTIDPTSTITSDSKRVAELASYVGNANNFCFLPLTTQKANIYLSLFVRSLMAIGVDFFYIDYNNIKDRENLWLFNHYHYVGTSFMLKKRGMVMSRNTMMATHRYPILYSGNTRVSWDTLANLPFYNSSASNMGISYWAHAIGGFEKGIEDSELYVRYIEFGTFSPIFILASADGKYYKREPWKWNDVRLAMVTRYMQLRVKLIPYLYNECYNYHKNGLPIIQPLYYKYPKIVDEPQYKNQYFFGSQILVAPITARKNYVMNRAILKVFIPDGVWYDFLTGKKYPGPNYYMSFYRDAEYPVFCKAGAIIPLSLDNGTDAPLNMEVQIFPGASNIYRLFEDDGITDGYKNGRYLITEFDYQYQNNGNTLVVKSIEGSGFGLMNRNYRFRFRNVLLPSMLGTYIDKKQVANRCYIDENDFIVELTDVPIRSEIIINFTGASEVAATSVINEEIAGILDDLEIETLLKEKIDAILFSDMSIKKKRIEIKKLRKFGLEAKFEKMFINLLEYIQEV